MKKYCFIGSMLLLAACSVQRSVVKNNAASPHIVVDGKLWASLFQQRAAEYKALCLQAYNIATLRLNEALQQPGGKPKAVVTDLDETALDNSPYAVHQALQGKDYETGSWRDWTSRGMADTLAGAVSFFKYAAAHQVEVFYITNRDEKERAGTLQNLQRYGFPYADDAHLLLKPGNSGSSKETRRQTVAQTHDIVLLLGDNLADFSVLFDKKSQQEREQNTLQSAADFGRKFIVLPNPSYGDWEGALSNYRHLDAAQKDSVVKANVSAY